MKVIVLKVDENKNAHVFKPDDMEAKECINLMLDAAIFYYKQYRNIKTLERATVQVAAGLLNGLGIPTKITFSNDKGGR